MSGREGPEQAVSNEMLSRLHHMLPHLKRSPLLIEECESLLPTHRTALLVAQSYQVRKGDFSNRSFSVFLLGHYLDTRWLVALQGTPANLRTQLLLIAWRRVHSKTHRIDLLAIIRFRNPQPPNLVL